jgi:hypothetical protein
MTSTDYQNFCHSPSHRLVATFPLSGRTSDAYTVWIFMEGTPSERYAVCDNYGHNFAGPATMSEALDLCLRNCGWGLRTRLADREEDYA